LIVAINSALPVISISFSVIASVMDCKNADVWVLASAAAKSSVIEKEKLDPASDANGVWAKLDIPNMTT
jgi:hypothetical protein